MTMVKILDLKRGGVYTIKVKVVRKSEWMIHWCIRYEIHGYYEAKQSNIQYHLKLYYEFKPLQALYGEFNKLKNILRREEQSPLIHIHG